MENMSIQLLGVVRVTIKKLIINFTIHQGEKHSLAGIESNT